MQITIIPPILFDEETVIRATQLNYAKNQMAKDAVESLSIRVLDIINAHESGKAQKDN